MSKEKSVQDVEQNPQDNQPQEHQIKEKTLYETIGGATVIQHLVNRFYEVMETDPKAAEIRVMHQADLASANEKLVMFLSGWMGGPQLYIEKYGHPRLRARHFPFPIGEAERNQWVYCMVRAMHDVGIEEQLTIRLAKAFWDIADMMRNKEG
ncbi:MAG: group II truncated hemoglobin [Methylophilaceae bacterium]|nr:group II truncated hemoglobin [Methylophilaceae bacterium]